jgi:hypothetical protein
MIPTLRSSAILATIAWLTFGPAALAPAAEPRLLPGDKLVVEIGNVALDVRCPLSSGLAEAEAALAGKSPAACHSVQRTIVRTNGTREPLGPALVNPSSGPSAAICIGQSDCEDLLVMCEKDKDCEFTCYWVGDGGCSVGSTD